MKSLLKIIFLCILVNNTSNGQDLKLPSSPAFSILGYEPTTLLRPNSFKQLSTDVLNSFDENGNLKMNLGIEIMPYWLKSNPELTNDQYLNPTYGQSFKQTLSFSIATVRDTITNNDNLGLGFRTQLIQGKLTSKFYDLKEIKLQAQTIVVYVTTLFDVLKPNNSIEQNYLEIENYIKNNSYDENLVELTKYIYNDIKNDFNENQKKEFYIKFNEKLIDSDYLNEIINQIAIENNKRTGLSLEFAAASKMTDVNQKDPKFDKIGFWINMNNFYTKNDAWTMNLRIMSSVRDTLILNSDFGIGYLKKKEKFSISLESMVRWYRMEYKTIDFSNQPIIGVEKRFTYKVVTQVSYLITNNISFNISLGKDFESPVFNKSTFFSIFGINYSLFKNFTTNNKTE